MLDILLVLQPHSEGDGDGGRLVALRQSPEKDRMFLKILGQTHFLYKQHTHVHIDD